MYTVKVRGNIFGMQIADIQLKTIAFSSLADAGIAVQNCLLNLVGAASTKSCIDTINKLVAEEKFGKYVQACVYKTHVLEIAVFKGA